MRTKWIPLCLVAAGVASAGYAQQRDAASQAQTTTNSLTPAEVQLVNKLHAANLEEIAAGKYATSHARNEAVKTYGQELQKHHTEADRELQALASRAGVKLSEPQTGAASKRLQKPANPATFDRPFLIESAKTQNDALAQVHEAQGTAVSPALKTLLQDLPEVLQQEHDRALRLLENTL